MVVVHSHDRKLGDTIRDLGYELEIEHGLVLFTQVMSQQQYSERAALGSTFLGNVEREGLAV